MRAASCLDLYLRDFASGQLTKNVATVASGWQHRVQFVLPCHRHLPHRNRFCGRFTCNLLQPKYHLIIKVLWSHSDSDNLVALLKLFFIFYVTQFCLSGNIEVLHNVMLKYMPKRIAFSYKGMKARTMLAVLDDNFNVGRRQATTKYGSKRWVVHWSKATCSFITKKFFKRRNMISERIL